MTFALIAVLATLNRGAVAARIMANLDSDINYTHPHVALPEGPRIIYIDSGGNALPVRTLEPLRLDGSPTWMPPQVFVHPLFNRRHR